MVGVPLQRPARFGTRNVLTDEEFAQRAQGHQGRGRVARRRDRRLHRRDQSELRHPVPDLAAAALAGDAASRRGRRRSSSIRRTAASRRCPRKDEASGGAAGRAARAGNGCRDARPTAITTAASTTAASRAVLGSLLPAIYNNGNEIVQGPGYVVIRNEMIHETRSCPLDGRPHVPAIKSYMGDSRGHWEGNTLVVETTNLNGMTGVGGNGGGRTSDPSR